MESMAEEGPGSPTADTEGADMESVQSPMQQSPEQPSSPGYTRLILEDVLTSEFIVSLGFFQCLWGHIGLGLSANF